MTAAIDKKYLNQLVHVIIAACQGDAVIGGDAVGTPSMPLELKVRMVLRTLAGGLMFRDAARSSQFMSE